jgi:hypothetical protein
MGIGDDNRIAPFQNPDFVSIMNDWQTWAALAVVAIALALLIRRALRRRGDCGGNCDCPRASRPKGKERRDSDGKDRN